MSARTSAPGASRGGEGWPSSPDPDHLTDVARGGLLNIVGVVVAGASSYALVIVVTRGLGAVSTGVFFTSLAFFHIVATVAQWGSEAGVTRFIPRYRVMYRHADIGHMLWAAVVPVLAGGTLLAASVFLWANGLGSLLTNGAHADELGLALRVLTPFIPLFAVYVVLLAVSRGFGTMLPSTAVDKIGRAAAQPLLVLAIVIAGLGTAWVALAWALPIAVSLVVLVLWVVHLRSVHLDAGRALATDNRRSVWAEFWRFASPRGLAGAFAVAILWLDTLLLGSMRGPAEAGMYAAATRYLTFGQLVGVALLQVVGPKLSELLARNDRSTAKEVYATATWWLIVCVWPLYLTMIVMSPALLSVFGPGYQEAGPVLMILGASMLIATVIGPVDMVLLMAGRSSWNLLNTVIAITANVGLNLLLIPHLGISGAAIAWSASILINNLLPLVQVYGTMRLHPFGSGTLAAAGAAAICFGGLLLIARAVAGDSLTVLLVSGSLVTGLYAVVLWRLRRVLRFDALRDAVRRRRSQTATPLSELVEGEEG